MCIVVARIYNNNDDNTNAKNNTLVFLKGDMLFPTFRIEGNVGIHKTRHHLFIVLFRHLHCVSSVHSLLPNRSTFFVHKML